MFTGKFENEYPDLNVAFYGKIYNKRELGFSPETANEEITAAIYKRDGTDGFSRLDGSFTFIIASKGETLIVRDHHGTGPQLYYDENRYASSLSLLLEEMENPTPDLGALSSFLSVGYIETPYSSFRGVRKLPAGSFLFHKDGKITIRNLFDTDAILPNSSEGDLETLSKQYGGLHSNAIRRRIGESRNVGILLSGGYDSGCNLAALRQNYDGDIRSYSIGFKGDAWSELPLAQCMSDKFGTIHHKYEIDGSEIKALPDIIAELGDPFVEGGLMVNYAAMRMIGSDKPDIILGGDGSDQYFGTSGREVAIHHLAAKYGIKPIMTAVNGMLSHEMFDKNNKPYRVHFHLNKILNILQGDMFGIEPFQLKGLIKDKSLVSGLKNPKPDNRSFEHLYTQHAYKADLEKTINQVILFKASRMAEMFGNDIAFPYMDRELYDFLKTLPIKYKCSGNSPLDIARGRGTAKFLLKYHYKPMLPAEITAKKKQGGFAPMPIFFKNKAQRGRIADFILHSSAAAEFFDRKGLEKFIRTYDNEADTAGNWFWYKQNKAIQYFNLLTMAIWWEQYIKRSKVSL